MTLQEKKQFDHLKALANYKKIGVGPEALLFKKMLDRRKAVRFIVTLFIAFEFMSYEIGVILHIFSQITPGWCIRTKNYNKCVFSEGGVKCLVRVIPSTKYCKKHILSVGFTNSLKNIRKISFLKIYVFQDKAQVLFQECGIQKNDHTCREPVVPIPNVTCIFHNTLPERASDGAEVS